jgi:hypothetical protein
MRTLLQDLQQKQGKGQPISGHVSILTKPIDRL